MMDIFYFGRLNLLKNQEGQKKDIFDLLNFGFKFRKGNVLFGIFEIKYIKHQELGSIITGELVKYQDYKEEQVVDTEKNELTTLTLQDVILGQSEFYLLEKSHLIAFNPYGKIIDVKAFCEAFTGIILGADDSFYTDSKIYPVMQEYVFLEFLRKMQTLEKLTISLTPSNPNNRDAWKKVDDKLNRMNLSNYKETQIAKKNQSIIIDEETESKIAMAADGYGKAVGEGKDEAGFDTKISTNKKESMLSKDVQKDSTIDEKIEGLRPVFDNVLERFDKKENTWNQ